MDIKESIGMKTLRVLHMHVHQIAQLCYLHGTQVEGYGNGRAGQFNGDNGHMELNLWQLVGKLVCMDTWLIQC